MNECLVTRLKGVCDNDDLLKYNEIRIYVKTVINEPLRFVGTGGQPATIKIIPDEGSTIHFSDSTYSENLGLEITEAAGQDIYVTPGSGIFSVIGKYDFFDLAFRGTYNGSNIIKVNISDFAYSRKLIRLMVSNSGSTGELFDLSEFNDISAVDFGNCGKVTGDISSLVTPAQGFAYITVSGSGVTGNIASLGPDIHLTTLGIRNTAIEGTLESFCEAQISNGRTSGTLSFDGRGSSVTYNNSPIESSLTITFNNGNYTVA